MSPTISFEFDLAGPWADGAVTGKNCAGGAGSGGSGIRGGGQWFATIGGAGELDATGLEAGGHTGAAAAG